MASDLSNIIKEDISNTLGSLLSSSTSVDTVTKVISSDIGEQQCVLIDVDYEFSGFETVRLKYYIPSAAATKFEYLMLGGVADLKESIDDEILDAVNEIISNICGSMSTNINAQKFDDLGTMKFTIVNSGIIQCDSSQSLENLYKLELTLGDDSIVLFIEFTPSFIPYIEKITSDVPLANNNDDVEESSEQLNSGNELLTLLGEDSIDNLKLLFDIKFKLSVRLGTKIVLLKDIMGWDTGTIIELEQMVNQPLDILANGIKIGSGEAVIVEGKFGVKIKHIGERKLN